jgi:DNA-binding CsgD family transcriptional regulator
MARAIPTVTGDRLTPGPGQAAIPVGGSAWSDWLAAPGSVSFHFAGPAGEFTARREKKGAGYYWYAYRRQGATVRKAYLGKASGLTPARLSAAAARLAAPVSPSPPPAAPVIFAADRFAPRPPAARDPGAAALSEPLSARERETLRLLGTGLSGPDIARALSVSPSTVKTHLKSVYGKLDAHSRAEAVAKAQALGLL